MVAGGVRGVESTALIKDTGDQSRKVRELRKSVAYVPKKKPPVLSFEKEKGTIDAGRQRRVSGAVREKPDSPFIIEIGTKKISELRELAGRLEARATRKALARSMPRLCADLLTAARELRHLCRALEVAGKDSITIKAELDREQSS
jgi:hypothetical protein